MRPLPLVALGLASLLAPGTHSAPNSPAELPLTLTDGDLKVTILQLAPMTPPGGGDPNDLNESVWTRVRLKLDRGEKPIQGWGLASIQVTSSRGETYRPRRTTLHINKDGETTLGFSGPLWSNVEPWRVRLELARTSPYQPYEFWKVFRDDEIITVPAVPVLREGETAAGGKVVEAQGARVRFLGAAGPNAPVAGSLPQKYALPSIHYQVERPKDVHVTFLRATDASGKVLKQAASGLGYTATGEKHVRSFEVPAGVREIYLAMAVHKSRVFEFTAIPSP